MRKLRNYQLDVLEKIHQNTNTRIVVQLSTGGGKTVIFSELAETHSGRVLILVDSRELVKQTANHIRGSGTFEAKNKAMPNTKIVISMAQTLRSRIKTTPEMLDPFDLVIIDECHILCYEQILEFINCKVVGFTATPVSMRKDKYLFCHEHKEMTKEGDCCSGQKIEFTKDFALSDIFQDIIVGIPISKLIEQGYLVQDENYVIPVDEESFKFDSFGEVTNSSEVFDFKFQMDVLRNYREYCLGKKTMIFTQNTELNLLLYNQFVDEGIQNVFMYDSVNETNFNRTEVVDKFRDIDGSILFNVGVFTKGFDVTDVECIIVARRVSSLALWIQIVGRGSRTTDKVFKDKFVVIDGGTNIQRLGRWSEDIDWAKHFWGTDDYKPKKEPPEDEPQECDNCAEFMIKNTCICQNCGHNNCKPKEVTIVDSLAVKVNTVGIDYGKIIRYSEGKDKFFAFKVLTSQVLRLFDSVTKEQFERNLHGGVERVLNTTLKKGFFIIIRSDLPSSANRTFSKQKEIVLTKLKKKYDIL